MKNACEKNFTLGIDMRRILTYNLDRGEDTLLGGDKYGLEDKAQEETSHSTTIS